MLFFFQEEANIHFEANVSQLSGNICETEIYLRSEGSEDCHRTKVHPLSAYQQCSHLFFLCVFFKVNYSFRIIVFSEKCFQFLKQFFFDCYKIFLGTLSYVIGGGVQANPSGCNVCGDSPQWSGWTEWSSCSAAFGSRSSIF